MKFLPLIFAAVVYVCYGVVHPEWFNYHEQYQLFMFGWDYLSEHLSYASGVSVYLSERFFSYTIKIRVRGAKDCVSGISAGGN